MLFQKAIVGADELTFAMLFRKSCNKALSVLFYLMHRLALKEYVENLEVITSR